MEMTEINLTSMKKDFEISQTKKMPLWGRDKVMDVYRIPLDLLYYNDLNDRIATYISKYTADEKSDIADLSVEKRNEIIEQYIIDSDKEHFNKTKENIRSFWQLEPWVVFSDWRVIDGNRRFTCLRNLRRETWDQKFNYFEAVILDNVDEKQLKIIELMIQQGRDERVDYNPIEKLVWVYRDIIKSKKLTVKEYAKYTDKTPWDIQKMVDKAEIMVDFLNYIKAPEEFYIAKDLELDSPLTEISAIKKRITDVETWAKARVVLYDMMWLKTKNDTNDDIKITIRNFWNSIIKDESRFNDYFTKHKELSKKLHDKLWKHEGKVTTTFIREEIRWNSEITESVDDLVSKTLYDAKKDAIQLMPIEQIKEINNDLDKIDKTAISKLQWETKQEFWEVLSKIQNKITRINELLENGIN